MVVQKGKEIGNISTVAREHELDPEMVLRWAKELNRKDLEQLKSESKRVATFIPTADDYLHNSVVRQSRENRSYFEITIE